ncbi:MAG: hypothetical protein NT040_07550 [Bacteroidetes bacterium]|nr:hypothetical protein [Bacteroidota bacterium]
MYLNAIPRELACTFLFLACLCSGMSLQAQDEKVQEEIEAENMENTATINFGADLVSRYIWRGIDFGNSPAVQPNLSVSWKGLNIGAWGSYAFMQQNIRLNDTTVVDAGTYAETDLFISYTFHGFTLMVFDYFTVNGLSPNEGNRYFDYKNATTGHTFEGSVLFEGPEKFPLQAMACTMFYGADKSDDSTNNYSTYLELAYKIHLKKIGVELKPFIGGIPFSSSWYGPCAGVTNLGLMAKKEIPLSAQYSLPVQVSLVTNPQAQSVFFIFGISF